MIDITAGCELDAEQARALIEGVLASAQGRMQTSRQRANPKYAADPMWMSDDNFVLPERQHRAVVVEIKKVRRPRKS